MRMHARNDHRNAHVAVVGIDADSAQYRVKTHVGVCVCENASQRGRPCETVCMCVVYNGSPMLLFRAQVGMWDVFVWPFLTARVCGGTEADVIRDIPVEVNPGCLRCRCKECSVVIEKTLKHIKADMDSWNQSVLALFGYLWIPSLLNMRVLHLTVLRSADAPRAELATLFLQADRAQKRKRWLSKRVLDQWFRFVAWRLCAQVRLLVAHRVPFECLAIIGAMAVAPPRQRIFRH